MSILLYNLDYPELLLNSKVERWEQINKAHDRSKYIVRGHDVVQLGNHEVWETKKTSLVFHTGNFNLINSLQNQST